MTTINDIQADAEREGVFLTEAEAQDILDARSAFGSAADQAREEGEAAAFAAAEEALTSGVAAALTNSVLKIWQEVLVNADADRDQRISPRYANSIVSNWPKLGFGDVSQYHQRYFAHLIELRYILDEEIASDPKAFDHIGEDDAELNREHYINLLTEWQVRIAQWEAQWDVDDEHAAAELAAVADVTAFFVGPQGLVEHLSQIGMLYTDEDRDRLRERLIEADKEARGE